MTTYPSSQLLTPSHARVAGTHCPLRQVNVSASVQLLYADTHIFPPFCSTKLTSVGQLHSTLSPLGVHTWEHPPLLLSHGLLPATHIIISCCKITRTSSSAVAKRPRDASCLSVVSFNSTQRRAESFVSLFSCLWCNVKTCCQKHFVVVSRHQQTPPPTTSDNCHNLRDRGPARRRIDNTSPVAALTARSEARYRLRIAISAYSTCIRRPR